MRARACQEALSQLRPLLYKKSACAYLRSSQLQTSNKTCPSKSSAIIHPKLQLSNSPDTLSPSIACGHRQWRVCTSPFTSSPNSLALARSTTTNLSGRNSKREAAGRLKGMPQAARQYCLVALNWLRRKSRQSDFYCQLSNLTHMFQGFRSQCATPLYLHRPRRVSMVSSKVWMSWSVSSRPSSRSLREGPARSRRRQRLSPKAEEYQKAQQNLSTPGRSLNFQQLSISALIYWIETQSALEIFRARQPYLLFTAHTELKLPIPNLHTSCCPPSC